MKKDKDLWFCSAEITRGTIFMVSVPLRFFFTGWPRLGLGSKVKSSFNYFKGDFTALYYKRSEFDAEADFLAKKMISNPEWALKILEKVEVYSNNFIKESNKFFNLPFSKMKPVETLKAYQRVFKWQELSHGIGSAIAWHADADKERISKSVTEMIRKQIKKRKLKVELANVFSILSTPTKESFVAEEEKEFLKVAQQIYSQPKIKQVFKKTKLDLLSKKIKEIDLKMFKILQTHFKEWAWLPYEYKGPAYPFKYFLEQWQILIKKNVVPNELLKKILAKEKKVKQKQKYLFKKLKFNSYQLKLIKMCQEIVFIKELRKGALYHGMYYYQPLFRQIAKKLKITCNNIRAMTDEEILKALKGGKTPKREILNARMKCSVFYITAKKTTVLIGKRAQDFFNKLPKEKLEIQGQIDELKGTCASPGRAKGQIRIVEYPKDLVKMKKGDILISETTYPSLVPAMKNAAAIVTNAGGLSCHAAIVSRELGIPCVVGTKIVTKIFKDGDMVEVDATKGTIKRLD